MKSEDQENTVPFQYMGDGQFQSQAKAWRALCDRRYVIGEYYRFNVRLHRSVPYHRLFFGVINKAFDNLPDALATFIPSPEHLRKFCLIKVGYSQTAQAIVASDAEAARTIKLLRMLDEYAIIERDGRVLTVHTAKSMAFQAMGRPAFNDVADRVFAYLGELIGVDPLDLIKETEREMRQ